jgi:hypothetical protein
MGGDFASFFRHSDADQMEKNGGKWKKTWWTMVKHGGKMLIN